VPASREACVVGIIGCSQGKSVPVMGGVSTGCVSIEGVVSLEGWRISNRPSTYMVVLAVAVWSWAASCVHCVKVTVCLAGSCGRMGGVDG